MAAVKSKIDKGTLAGVLCALGGVLGGLLLEDGSLADIAQLTAAMIVFGGTLGAVLIGNSMSDVLAAVRDVRLVFRVPADNSRELLAQLVGFAAKARKQGIVSLDSELETIEDPFLRKALTLAIDGTELSELREMMELDRGVEEQRMLARAVVFESAGGYSPTIGIIGAVLGLIQVMKNLANIEEVGHGIAVAFVATVYGVGAANILFLPAASKIRGHVRRRMEVMDLIVEGVAGIVEGKNPRMISRKLAALANAPEDEAERIAVSSDTPERETLSV